MISVVLQSLNRLATSVRANPFAHIDNVLPIEFFSLAYIWRPGIRRNRMSLAGKVAAAVLGILKDKPHFIFLSICARMTFIAGRSERHGLSRS
jgi:hypothetical protein